MLRKYELLLRKRTDVMNIMDERIKMRWIEARSAIANAYHDYGRFCAAHPKACITVSIILMIVLPIPVVTRLRLPVSTPIDIFWSEHLHVNEKIAPFWINDNPASYIQQFVIFTSLEPWNATVMSPEQSVRAAVATAFRVRKILLETAEVEELCLHLATPSASVPWPFRSKSLCVVTSPASIWYNDEQKFREDPNLIETIFNEECKSTFCMRDLLLGAPIANTGLKQFYQTNRKRTIQFGVNVFFARYSKRVITELRERLMKEFEVISSTNDDRTFVQVYYHPLKKFSDYVYLLSTYVVCMIYVYYSSRKFEMVASRWGLSLASCVTVAFTLLMTAGICTQFNLSTITWGAEIFPYIALILGLENTFCITRSVVYTPPSLDVSSRIAHGLSQEGYKLTKYYFMEMFALICGYLTGVSDIQDFCKFSAVCITVDFYMQLFFYAPCLTFDLERLGLEEKRKFAEILLYGELPRLKNYAPVSCPMRKYWPQLFAVKKMQKRRLSDSGVEDVFTDAIERKKLISISKDDSSLGQSKTSEDSIRMKIIYFITRTRIVQRTILVVFAIWTVWLAFFVGSRQTEVDNTHNNQSIETITQSRRILSTANLQYGEWQRRTYSWWPAVAHEYNISLNSRYVTFLPPIVVNAIVSPDDYLMQIVEKVSKNNHIDEHNTNMSIDTEWNPIYFAIFCLIPVSIILSFFGYMITSGKWKFGSEKVQQPQIANLQTGTCSPNANNFIETLPILFKGHLYPIETISVDDKNPSIFVSCCQEGVVMIWNSTTGERITRLNRLRAVPDKFTELQQPPKVWSLAICDDIVIIGCSDGSVEVASITRNKLIGVYSQTSIGVSHVICQNDTFVVIRLDGTIEFVKVIYEAGEDAKIRVREFQVIKCIKKHQKAICRAVTWKDALITSSFDRSIRMWNWNNGEMINVFLAHNAPVVSLVIDYEQSMMYSSCEEGMICWWNLETGEPVRTVDTNSTWAYQLATSNEYLLGLYGSSQLSLWSIQNGQLITKISASDSQLNEDTQYSVGSSSVISFDDDIAATASGTYVTFWDLKRQAIIGKTDVDGKIVSMRKLGKNSVLCSAENTIYSITAPIVRFK